MRLLCTLAESISADNAIELALCADDRDADSLCLVMERLHQDCKHVLQTHGAMSETQAMPLLADMVLALEHHHTCGIVHRDLKPENMLLTPSGRLKLADFGLSHIAARASSRSEEVAKDPSIVGTRFYMAPETIRGKSRGFETAADWWSFGVIMYEFLPGFPPFQVRLPELGADTTCQ